MEADVAAVEQALAALYTNPDAAQKKTAEKWLAAVRNVPGAWDLGWQLLQGERCLESQFFGANVILHKVLLHARALTQIQITSSWKDLSEEQQVGLKDQLLARLVMAVGGPRVILTRLCILLSSLCLQVLSFAAFRVPSVVILHFSITLRV
jgi:hypothetical protein